MGHVWLRTEYKKGEQRTPLAPHHAKVLIEQGHIVTVEQAPQRIFSIQDYRDVGCQIVPAEAWEVAPNSAYIVGLKNLPDTIKPLKHKHIYFAHAFKNQPGADQLLRRFILGGGSLLDLEYLVDENGKRVSAFGFYAGVAGAAISVMLWCLKVLGEKPPYKVTYPYCDYQSLVKEVANLLAKVGVRPSVLVIGGRGRCGLGATHFLQDVSLSPGLWTRAETARVKKEMQREMFAHDIMLNCIYVDGATSPFLTKQDLQFNRTLSVIGDISCEPGHVCNPLPIYTKTTSFDNPSLRIGIGNQPLDLISIDNLPTLLPFESSINFSEQLINHLQNLLSVGMQDAVWRRADEKCKQVMDEYFPAGLKKII